MWVILQATKGMQEYFLCAHLMSSNLGLQAVPSKENNKYHYLWFCLATLAACEIGARDTNENSVCFLTCGGGRKHL